MWINITKSRIRLVVLTNIMALFGLVICAQNTYADSSKLRFDPRECVCTFTHNIPIDIFTARVVETPLGYKYEVVDILAHGVPARQVPGELISGLAIRHGTGEIAGAFLVYEGSRRDEFYVISIPSFDLDTAQIRSLSIPGQPGGYYDTACNTEFSLSQLKVLVDVLTTGKGTCPTLATRYLHIPAPPDDGQCGGGTSPGWLASILAALGLLAFRARRRRPSVEVNVTPPGPDSARTTQ